MTSEDFVRNFYIEKKNILELCFGNNDNYDVTQLISDLQLDIQKKETLKQILNYVLRDAFYSTLLGLDGAAQIGEVQEPYKIEDEDGNELGGGEIESFAYDYFHDNKFEIDNSSSDFIASLRYRTTEEDGRKTPAKSGYRPQVKFEFDDKQSFGLQVFIGRELVYPGDSVEAEITLLSIDHLENKLVKGMTFEFLEGTRVIGSGKIKHIMNDILKKIQ